MNNCYWCGKKANYILKNGKRCCSEKHTKCSGFQSSVTYAKSIVTNKLCSYGCNKRAKYLFKKSNNLCCSKRLQSCPAIRQKNSQTNMIKQAGENNAMFGRKHTVKSIEKNRQSNKALWADPNSVFNSPEWKKRLGESVNIRPNKPETIIYNILNDLYPNMFSYTGDFTKFIGRKNPDFICEKLKLIIEHFGNYYHSEEKTGMGRVEHEQDRRDYFSKYGFTTLIIWESDLYENIDECVNRIKNFTERNGYDERTKS